MSAKQYCAQISTIKWIIVILIPERSYGISVVFLMVLVIVLVTCDPRDLVMTMVLVIARDGVCGDRGDLDHHNGQITYA